jgi:hypothetical protein
MKLGVLRHTRLPPASLKIQNFQAKSRMVASSLSSSPNILITEKAMLLQIFGMASLPFRFLMPFPHRPSRRPADLGAVCLENNEVVG